MGIIKDKGRWERSSLSNSKVKSLRNKHPLNFQTYSMAAHHLISCEVAKKLSSIRKKQIVYKGYDINYLYNLVLLPTIDQVSCQYNVPLHKSGHTDRRLEEYFQRESGKNLESELSELESDLKQEADADKSKLLAGDLSMVASVRGYHKVVGSMLAKTLKNLDCDTEAQEYVDSLDELSIDIADLLGCHKLHLISRGRHLTPSGKGCHMCRSGKVDTPRLHYLSGSRDFDEPVPSQAKVKKFCFEGASLKTMGELV
ncbi:AHH domain-containing protein [Vibrio alginolyticus]